MPDGLTVEEFAAAIKRKMPDYSEVDDYDLTQRYLKKHPVYKESVTFGPRERAYAAAARAGLTRSLADDFLNVTGGIESGNRHYGSGGKVLESPPDPRTGERAVGFSQIKPSTIKPYGLDPYDEDQNIEGGLRYFSEGGIDPVARRIYYFGGPRALQRYRTTGRIPKGNDWRAPGVPGTTFEQYVKRTMPKASPTGDTRYGVQPLEINTETTVPQEPATSGGATTSPEIKPETPAPTDDPTKEPVGYMAQIQNYGPDAEAKFHEYVRLNTPVSSKAKTVGQAASDQGMAWSFLKIADFAKKNKDADTETVNKGLARIGVEFLQNPETTGSVLPTVLHDAMLAARYTPDEWNTIPEKLRQQIRQYRARVAVQRGREKQVAQLQQDVETLGPTVEDWLPDLDWHLRMSPQEFQSLKRSQQRKVVNLVAQRVRDDQLRRQAGQQIAAPSVEEEVKMRNSIGLPRRPVTPLNIGQVGTEGAGRQETYSPFQGFFANAPKKMQQTPDDLLRSEAMQQVIAERAARREGPMTQARASLALADQAKGTFEDQVETRFQELKHREDEKKRLLPQFTPAEKESLSTLSQQLERHGTGIKRGVDIGVQGVTSGFLYKLAGAADAALAGGPNTWMADWLRKQALIGELSIEEVRKLPSNRRQDVAEFVSSLAASLPEAVGAASVLGPVAGFAALGASEAQGRKLGAGAVAKEATKGALIGKVFDWSDLIATSSAPASITQTIKNVTKKAATVGTGTTAVELVSGTPPVEAIKAGLTNALLPVVMAPLHGKAKEAQDARTRTPVQPEGRPAGEPYNAGAYGEGNIEGRGEPPSVRPRSQPPEREIAPTQEAEALPRVEDVTAVRRPPVTARDLEQAYNEIQRGKEAPPFFKGERDLIGEERAVAEVEAKRRERLAKRAEQGDEWAKGELERLATEEGVIDLTGQEVDAAPVERRSPERMPQTDWMDLTPEEQAQVRQQVKIEQENPVEPTPAKVDILGEESPRGTFPGELAKQPWELSQGEWDAAVKKGKLAPFAGSEFSEIDAVATGKKPIALIVDAELPENRIRKLKRAKELGLELEKEPEGESYGVFKKGNRQAFQNWLDVMDRGEKHRNVMLRDIEEGRALGYSEADIVHYLEKYYGGREGVLKESRNFDLGTMQAGEVPRETSPTGDTLITGERSDISLSQFVRKRGGIVPAEMYKGELDRLRKKETGTTGLINKNARQGNLKQTADIMMEAANEAGFRDKNGQPFTSPGDFLRAVERDIAGEKTQALTGAETNWEAKFRERHAKEEQDFTKAEALVNTLESGRGAELFDKIAEGKANDAERQELTELAREAGADVRDLDHLIAEAEAERTAPEPVSPPVPKQRAEQLGFVEEGLTQQTAPSPKTEQQGALAMNAEQFRQYRSKRDAEIADKHGKGYVKKYWQAADRLFNASDVVEYRANGVIVKDGNAYTLKVFGDTDSPSAKWRVAAEIDVSDQFIAKSQIAPEEAAAHAKLEEIKRRGLTIDDYARQPDLLTGETPSAEEVKALRAAERAPKVKEEEPGLNFGPGTMRAGEPLPEVKERKFGKRFTEDERIAQDIRDSIGTAKYYEPISDKVTVKDATRLIDERGLPQALKDVRDEGNKLPFRVRVAMGEETVLRLNESYKRLKEAKSPEADFVLDQATDVSEFLMEYGTRLGQGVQAFATWARLTPEGKLLTYKRAVDKARQKVNVDEVREIVDTVNKEMTDAERIAELDKLFKRNKTAQKVKSSFDKLLEAAKDGKLTDELFYEVVSDRLGLPKYDKETAKKITDLALEIEAAPEGMPRDKKILELSKFLAQQKGFDPSDLLLGIYYANILSGYNTHLVNANDTAFNVMAELNGLAINNPRAASWVASGLFRGFGEGKLDALLALTQGRMVTDGKWLEVPKLMEIAKFGQKGGVPIKTETRAGRATKAIAESKVAYPLNAYKYVTRLLAASDAVFFRTAKEARASLLAYRMAQAEGLKGDLLESRVQQILGMDREADFAAQARREGFTGVEAQVRTKELRDMVRDKDLSADAAEFAGEATYNHDPHGILGYFSKEMSKASEKVKLLKLFVPFTRIVANVTNRGLNYTPWGYKRAFFGYSFEGPLTPEARRLMLTRATLGLVGINTLAALQAGGLLQIHGNGPSDKEKRRQMQAAGWRPYTLQIGDKYISYMYTPLALGLSITGNMTDSERYHELEQKDAATRGAYAVARLGSTIFSQSFLSGLSRLFNALSEEPSQSVTAVKQVLGSTVAAATTPNLARDIYRLFDNKAYQSNTLMEDLIRNTPFAALKLKPQLNAFGEPVQLQRQRFFDVLSSDPAWRFVITKNLRVPVPSRTTELSKGERISPDEYYNLLLKTGPRLKQWITDNQKLLGEMKEQDAQEEVSKASAAITKDELENLRKGKGMVRERVITPPTQLTNPTDDRRSRRPRRSREWQYPSERREERQRRYNVQPQP